MSVKGSGVKGVIYASLKYFHAVSKIYFENRGNLLARGIAYSLLVTIVPSLFMAIYVATIFFNHSPSLQSMVNTQIAQVLPVTYAGQVMEMVNNFMASGQWKHMGILGLLLFLATPSFLFASIERALSLVMNPPVERKFVVRQMFYFSMHILVMVLLFTFAFVTVWVRELGEALALPGVLAFVSSKGSTITIMGLSLAAIYRISYHHSINNRVLFSISFLLSLVWQAFCSSGSAIVAVSGKNEVLYGVMAGAIVLLALAYIFSFLLIVGGIIIGKESKIAGKNG